MSLGDRMKEYERVPQSKLTKKVPVIIRVDGRAFHTFTRGMNKPFDWKLISCMQYATEMVMRDMQGCKVAYTQSDEATFLLSDLDSIESQGWFDYKLSKIISMSASLMTVHFNQKYKEYYPQSSTFATFDSRAFNVPTSDVSNCFLWRAKDWSRNSIQMYARAFFSHKQVHRKNTTDLHNMLHEIGKNWTTDLNMVEKNGSFFVNTDDGIYVSNDVQPTYNSVNAVIAPFLENNLDN